MCTFKHTLYVIQQHLCILIQTYPCWMSSFSFATFLSSITVKDKTQNQRDVYDIVLQEHPVPHDWVHVAFNYISCDPN